MASAADVDESWELFALARAECGISVAKPPVRTMMMMHQQYRESLHQAIRRQHGILSVLPEKRHQCTRMCLQDGVQDIRYGLFLCMNSGKVHDCGYAHAHPLTHVDNEAQIICSMTGNVVGTNYDERTLSKSGDNGDGGRVRTRGMKTHKNGDYIDGECESEEALMQEECTDEDREREEEDDDDDDNNSRNDDDIHAEPPPEDNSDDYDMNNNAKRKIAATRTSLSKRQRIPVVRSVAAAIQQLGASTASLAKPMPTATTPMPTATNPMPTATNPMPTATNPALSSSSSSSVTRKTNPESVTSSSAPRHHEPPEASVLAKLSRLSAIASTGTGVGSKLLPSQEDEERKKTTASKKSKTLSSSTTTTTSKRAARIVNMYEYALKLAKVLFSEDTQRKALARTSKSARTKGKTAIRSYARITLIRGAVPQPEVASIIRNQFEEDRLFKEPVTSVRVVQKSELEELSTLVAKAWTVLKDPLQRNDDDSDQEEEKVGGGGGAASTAQRQTRLKQFFYGLLFLLRQGLKLDNDIEVFKPLSWLSELPELSILMQYAKAGKHKLLTDGRNAIVAAFRQQQARDATLRTILQHLYPERYLYD